MQTPVSIAKKFPHLLEIRLYEFILLDNDPTFARVTRWLEERKPNSCAMWAPWDASPIMKQAKNALLGFDNVDDVLVFKLTFPEVVVRYEVFGDVVSNSL
ncbi:hypothetical protein D3C87_587760 [compost metagenome]